MLTGHPSKAELWSRFFSAELRRSDSNKEGLSELQLVIQAEKVADAGLRSFEERFKMEASEGDGSDAVWVDR